MSKDFKIDWYSGTGKGGQHRNKHQNCCRVTHIPTGIQANGTQSRSRADNLRAAMSVCRSRVVASQHQDTERFRAGHERIRTYHEPDDRVTDHASGFTMSYRKILSDIGPMIRARKEAMAGE